MKTYIMFRDVDVSGVSGTGKVAEVVEFSNGKTIISWDGKTKSIVVYDTMMEAIAIHGHGGATRFIKTS